MLGFAKEMRDSMVLMREVCDRLIEIRGLLEAILSELTRQTRVVQNIATSDRISEATLKQLAKPRGKKKT